MIGTICNPNQKKMITKTQTALFRKWTLGILRRRLEKRSNKK
nr:MAG TPA: hypothetical protein [Caudoviricetes sp.]